MQNSFPQCVRGPEMAFGVKGDRNAGTLFCPASPCPAVCSALCRPDLPVVCLGFGLDKSCRACPGTEYLNISCCTTAHFSGSTTTVSRITALVFSILSCRVQNPDTQRAVRFGAAHGGRRGGAMFRRTGNRHFDLPGTQLSL